MYIKNIPLFAHREKGDAHKTKDSWQLEKTCIEEPQINAYAKKQSKAKKNIEYVS